MPQVRAASFTLNELPFVTVPVKAIPYMLNGDFRRVDELALENLNSVTSAIIKVENINGPILLISDSNDHVWPATEMASDIVNRLKIKALTTLFDIYCT
mgnify:CR=1 FL=1|tara:strand:+ start:1336 stop:1632 length:297 start_codon:yes stop_codon:yes gene_type:complete